MCFLLNMICLYYLFTHIFNYLITHYYNFLLFIILCMLYQKYVFVFERTTVNKHIYIYILYMYYDHEILNT